MKSPNIRKPVFLWCLFSKNLFETLNADFFLNHYNALGSPIAEEKNNDSM